MADLTSWIGGKISYVAAVIDRDADAAAYGLKTVIEIGTVKTIGALGDTTASISVSLLSQGRATRVNGEADAGEVNMAVAFDADDTSYGAIRTLAGTNTNVWFVIEDADGDKVGFQGLIANWQETERNNTTEKGATYVLRVNTGYTYY